MKKGRWLALWLAMAVLLSGCGKSGTDETETKKSETEQGKETVLNADLFTERDFEVGYDESTSTVITFAEEKVQCDSQNIEIEENTVKIKKEGTYILRGTWTDGMVVVDAGKKEKVQLVLDGVSIHSETSAPIYILQADKVFLTMAENSENSLSNGGTFTAIDDNNIDAVIFSKDDLTLNGNGALTITSPAGHGIVGKDEVTITGGTYVITSASHGIAGKDNVCLTNASVTIAAGKDGIHSENKDDSLLGFVYIQNGTYEITAEGDGISAGANLRIEDGTFAILTGGGSENAAKKSSDDWGNFGGGHGMGGPGMGGNDPGRGNNPGSRPEEKGTDASLPNGGLKTTSADMEPLESTEEESTSIKGIKAATNLTIDGGTFTIDSADDGVHSNGNLTVNGGNLTIKTGDDGFHADETLTIQDGTILITESYEGIEGLHVKIEGGDITLTASDDGVNAAGGTDSSEADGMRGGDQFGGPGQKEMGSSSSDGSICISGGNLHITASGDGMDANGTLEISGGTIVISGPNQGDTSTLDYDITGVITGGTFIGTGASGMAQTFSDSKQGVIAVNAGNQEKGTKITLKDESGKILMEHEAELDFSVVILSSPELISGETYTITVGTASGELEAS